MKKIYLLLVSLFACFIVGAQSQRIVLVEELTNASCPPCAAANPAFNALLDANTTKAVAIKYQTNWPGTDPMNAQNPSQVQTRVNYYSVSGVPTAVEDGNQFKASPTTFTQTKLDTRYATTSPFTIDVSHYFSPAHDSIYVHVVINCTQATSGTLVAHIGVIERDIYFSSPPGSNGETVFEGVMRRMLPTDQGTALASSWTAGNTLTINASWKLAYIYDTNQIGVVSWIQNNANKEVLQAGYSRPNTLRDAGVTNIAGLNPSICTSGFTPTVTLHNFSKYTLTSATINYSIDGGANQTYSWSGSLAGDGDAQIVMPAITLTAGKHTVKCSSSMPNGANDLDTHNDGNVTTTVVVLLTPAPSPLVQGFTGAVFPPTNWTLLNVDKDSYTWIRSSVGATGAGSAEASSYNSAKGTIDNLYSPTVDFTTAVAGSAIEFDVAHQQYSTTLKEQLKVDISSDCGATWTNVYDMTDPALASVAGYSTVSFVPTSAQWRHEKISLDQFIGQSALMARFQSVSGNGNNVYLDNVNISNGTTGVNEILNNRTVGLYPNPSNGSAFLKIDLDKPGKVSVTITNLLGEVVESFVKTNNGIYTIDLSKEPKGTYFVNLRTDDAVFTTKMVVAE